jgi:hypothetical protein
MADEIAAAAPGISHGASGGNRECCSLNNGQTSSSAKNWAKAVAKRFT